MEILTPWSSQSPWWGAHNTPISINCNTTCSFLFFYIFPITVSVLQYFLFVVLRFASWQHQLQQLVDVHHYQLKLVTRQHYQIEVVAGQHDQFDFVAGHLQLHLVAGNLQFYVAGHFQFQIARHFQFEVVEHVQFEVVGHFEFEVFGHFQFEVADIFNAR